MIVHYKRKILINNPIITLTDHRVPLPQLSINRRSLALLRKRIITEGKRYHGITYPQ